MSNKCPSPPLRFGMQRHLRGAYVRRYFLLAAVVGHCVAGPVKQNACVLAVFCNAGREGVNGMHDAGDEAVAPRLWVVSGAICMSAFALLSASWRTRCDSSVRPALCSARNR